MRKGGWLRVSSPRALLARVQKLEATKLSHFEKLLGPFEQFEAECRAGIEAGKYDPRDMPVVINCVRSWYQVA